MVASDAWFFRVFESALLFFIYSILPYLKPSCFLCRVLVLCGILTCYFSRRGYFLIVPPILLFLDTSISFEADSASDCATAVLPCSSHAQVLVSHPGIFSWRYWFSSLPAPPSQLLPCYPASGSIALPSLSALGLCLTLVTHFMPSLGCVKTVCGIT